MVRASGDERGHDQDKQLMRLVLVVGDHQQVYRLFSVPPFRGVQRETSLFSKMKTLTLMVEFIF